MHGHIVIASLEVPVSEHGHCISHRLQCRRDQGAELGRQAPSMSSANSFQGMPHVSSIAQPSRTFIDNAAACISDVRERIGKPGPCQAVHPEFWMPTRLTHSPGDSDVVVKSSEERLGNEARNVAGREGGAPARRCQLDETHHYASEEAQRFCNAHGSQSSPSRR